MLSVAVQHAHAPRPAESARFYEVLRVRMPFRFINVISGRVMGQPFGTRGSVVGKILGYSGGAVNTPPPPSFG